MLPDRLLQLPLCLLLLVTLTNGVLVNVTVDDSLPDPVTGQVITYLPENKWKAGAGCDDCTAALDGQKTYSGTWHDGTYDPGMGAPINATFKFNGTAIYVFCGIALSSSKPNGYSNMSFYIDGEFVHHFESVPPGIQRQYLYNVSVYSNTSLSPGVHTFMLQNGQYDNLGNKSLTLFDYLVYSYDDGKSGGLSQSPLTDAVAQTKMSTPIGVIAGVAVTAGFAILGGLVWFLRRRKYHVRDGRSLVSLESSHNDHLLPQPFITRSDYPIRSHTEQNALFLPVPVIKNRLSAVVTQQMECDSSNPSFPVTKSRVSSVVTTNSQQQREVDAGPIEVSRHLEGHEGFLPPDYVQVFSASRTNHAL